MGNQIVIPSMGNWFIDPLKRNGITVQSVLESGTFFITLDCIDSEKNSIIVKAYESDATIESNNIYRYCIEYNTVLKNSNLASKGISIYTDIITKQNLAFLCRKKHQFTLTQRLEEYPPLEPIEKQWIAFKFVRLVLTLHKKNLFHGSINPDNVFVDSDLQINLGDMAPFKPSYIKNTRPDLFHHLFTTASRSSCYLAPEQLLSPEGASDMLNFNGTFEMDYFSTGLVLYYLYTGEHLFTFLRLHQYKIGQFKIDNQIEKLPNEIRKLVASLLSLDPKERKINSKNINQYFPEIFHDISKYFALFLNPNKRFKHKIKTDIKEISTDQRLIFINLFLTLLNKTKDVQRKVKFASFICHYTNPLTDMVKLNRVLPYFCNMLTIRSNIIKCTALSCIVKLIQSIKSIPDELSSIFSSYLIPFIFKIGSGATVQFRSAMASLCPVLAVEIERLQPEADAKAMEMVNFIINEENTIVVGAFVETMKALSQPDEPESFIYVDINKDWPVRNIIPLIIELSKEINKIENNNNQVPLRKKSSQLKVDNQNQSPSKNNNTNKNTTNKQNNNEPIAKTEQIQKQSQNNNPNKEIQKRPEAKRKQSFRRKPTPNQKKEENTENQQNVENESPKETKDIINQEKKEEANAQQEKEDENKNDQVQEDKTDGDQKEEINTIDNQEKDSENNDDQKEDEVISNNNKEEAELSEDIKNESNEEQTEGDENNNDQENENDNEQKEEGDNNDNQKEEEDLKEEEDENDSTQNISQELPIDSSYQSSDDEDLKLPSLMNISPIIPQEGDEFGSYSDSLMKGSNLPSPSSSPNFSSINFTLDNDNETTSSNADFSRLNSSNSLVNSFSLISNDEKSTKEKSEDNETETTENKKEETTNETSEENEAKKEKKNKTFVKKTSSFLLQSQHSPKPLNPNESVDEEAIHRCKFETFEHFSTILISCLNSNYANYKVRILHIFIAFYDNSLVNERCYFRRLYSTIAPLLLGFLGDDSTNSNPTMIEGYLEFILWYVQRNLLSKVYIPELFLRLSKYRKSEVPVFRFYAEKIMSYLPQEFDAEKVTTFINQILFPQKQLKNDTRRKNIMRNGRMVLNTSDSSTTYGLGTTKKNPLLIKAGLSIKPKFIESFKISRQPIRLISPHFSGDLRSIVADEDGSLYSVTRSKTIEKCPKSLQINKKVLTMVELRNNNRTCMICNDRTLNYIDWKAMKIIPSKKIPSVPIKIDSRDQNVVYILCQNRSLYMIDMRTGRSLNLSFNKVLTPSALTFWRQSPTIGVGFKEGFVDLLDPRIMLVFKSIVTEPVYNIAPIQRDACNFAVSSDDKVLFYNASTDDADYQPGRADLSIFVDSPFINPYDGNAIVTGVNDVYHIDCENFERSSILGDFYKKKLLGISKNGATFDIEKNMCGYGSLHKHASKITCVDHNQELFMSGDINGFVNIWSLSGS